uniref:Uncharacterized protein n=1 Tax=Oryza punctata TaxID=4537 RepID=A0A0E0LPZ5_ORYPU
MDERRRRRKGEMGGGETSVASRPENFNIPYPKVVDSWALFFLFPSSAQLPSSPLPSPPSPE